MLPAPSPEVSPPRAPQASAPEQSRASPYFPGGPQPNLFEDFEGINTQVPRAGVADQQMFWCDGFMPITKRNLRTLYGVGTPIYTASGKTVVFFGFFSLNNIEYAAVFLSDGSIVQVNVATLATTPIAPAGTIQAPSIVNVGMTEFGDQYLIIVANQPNGYWIWDGTLFYSAGGLSPIVVLTNVGSSYISTPIVVATGGSGTGATFAATIANGVVTNVVETSPGSGYLPGQTITLVFSGGTQAGSGGVLVAVLSSTGGGTGAVFTITFQPVPGEGVPFYNVLSVGISNGGSGYSQFTTLSVHVNNPSSGGGAVSTVTTASIQPVIAGGIITGVTIVNPGRYELLPVGSTFTGSVSVADPGAFHVTSVTISNGGSNYSPSAVAVCSGGGAPVSQAVLQLILTAGVITGVTVASGGLYGSNTPPTVTVSDAAVNATATVDLMPFGVDGTAVESYAGHVWVINGPQVNATAPGSVDNFATSAGGVSFTSNNSYTQLISTNGFLYLIGDSATDYISGVTTTIVSSVPTTQYSFLNADPEVGTPYPASPLTFGNFILLANAVGVYFLAGSTFTKISDALDGSGMPHGLWNSVANFGGNQLSATKATLFDKKVWMILATVLDPVSGLQVNKLFLTDTKKWWATMQDVSLTFVASSEFNSVLTAYGTDGTHIYPLFQTPSTAFAKTVQSRFWDAPGGYTHNKASSRLFGMAYYYNAGSPSMVVGVDAIGQDSSASTQSYTITAAGTGYNIFPPEAVGQQGVLTGLTITTSAADVSLISAALQDEIVGYRG